MIVFTGGLERSLAPAVGETGVRPTAKQQFDRLDASPGGGVKQWAGSGLLVAGVDVGSMIQEKPDHLRIATQSGVMQWRGSRLVPDADLSAVRDQQVDDIPLAL